MISANGQMTGQANAKEFVNNVYSKYVKITKVCDKAKDCGFPEYIQPYSATAEKVKSSDLFYNLNPYVFTSVGGLSLYTTVYAKTADGYSARIYYNPKCGLNRTSIQKKLHWNSREYYVGNAICLNIIYDMNGTKAPNHAGYDIGYVSVFWSGPQTVAVAPKRAPFGKGNGASYCSSMSTKNKKYTATNVYELSSLIFNWKLSGVDSGRTFGNDACTIYSAYGDVSGYCYNQHYYCVER